LGRRLDSQAFGVAAALTDLDSFSNSVGDFFGVGDPARDFEIKLALQNEAYLIDRAQRRAANEFAARGLDQVTATGLGQGAVHALGSTLQPADLVAVGVTGFIKGGLRLATSELAAESFTVSTGLPFIDPRATLKILNQGFVPNTQRVLQNVTNQATGDILANPSLLRSELGPKAFSHLAGDTAQADRIFGRGVEKLVRQRIRADDSLSSILVRATQRGSNGRFIRSPDFIGIEGNQLRLLDITTLNAVPEHLRRSSSSIVDFVIQPGLHGPVKPNFR